LPFAIPTPTFPFPSPITIVALKLNLFPPLVTRETLAISKTFWSYSDFAAKPPLLPGLRPRPPKPPRPPPLWPPNLWFPAPGRDSGAGATGAVGVFKFFGVSFSIFIVGSETAEKFYFYVGRANQIQVLLYFNPALF
jgi:hypothetical protein